jgi:hypothetical protein
MKDQIQKNWYIGLNYCCHTDSKCSKRKKITETLYVLLLNIFKNPNPSFLNPKPIMEAGKEEIADVWRKDDGKSEGGGKTKTLKDHT